jgi:hypothetical protein
MIETSSLTPVEPAIFDLNSFSLSDVVRCGTRLRQLARSAPDPVEASQRVVRFLHEHIVDGATGEPAFVLVRLFRLDEDGLKLAAVAGEERTPYPDSASMTAELHYRLRVERGTFHVANATDSALNPDDEFATARGVRSILGLVGALDGGQFTIVAFSRVPLDEYTAELFRAVAVNIRLGLLDHLTVSPAVREAVVSELLEVLEETATAQALRLEETVAELNGAATRLRRSQRELRRREGRLREETGIVEALHSVGTDLAAELDMERVVQRATDVATELTGAAFGSFFYNLTDDLGESYLLYTLSGVPKEAFSSFPMPRNTNIFDPTFRGTAVVRSDDITQDPRYGQNWPNQGIPRGHLPVASYLAVPAISPTGEVLGGFFFGHPRPGRFTDRHERLAIGVAAHAAVALDNARLYRRERTAAVELQRSLLPRIQQFDGLEVQSRYLPAAKGAEVGGDWVDLVPLSAGRVALVVGDVMGKGIRAAAVMGSAADRDPVLRIARSAARAAHAPAQHVDRHRPRRGDGDLPLRRARPRAPDALLLQRWAPAARPGRGRPAGPASARAAGPAVGQRRIRVHRAHGAAPRRRGAVALHRRPGRAA